MWRLHLAVLAITALSEWIGVRELKVGPGVVLFVPLLYGFAFGSLSNPRVTGVVTGPFRAADLDHAQAMIVVAIFPFVARFGTLIGPTFDDILAAGPALILQELGNLATILVALPVAVLVLRMGREAIGATFSIAREPNIAIISDRYGLSGPEGMGVMSVYVLGTLFGTLVFAVMASFLGSSGVLHPESLAMACGVGSGSMMAACAGALASSVSGSREELLAFAGASNLLTYATGLYVGLFVALPLAERLYRVLQREGSAPKSTLGSVAKSSRPTVDLRASARDLLVACALIWVGNWIATGSNPGLSFQGVILLFLIAVAGLSATKWTPFYLPSVAWISLAGIAVSLPWTPGMSFVTARVETIGVLPAATPCLVYAGLALSEREITTFRRSGWRLVSISILVFAGTYLGSAVIAEAVLSALGNF